MLIRFDASADLIKLRNALANFSRRGLGHATRNSLNNAAFLAREQWHREMDFSFTLRNHWTKRSVQVVRATGANPSRMESKVGSVADYMGTQEKGGDKRKQHKHGVPIPTKVASGEGRGSGPRRRMVRAPNRMSAIQIGPRIGKNPKQRNAIAIEMARRQGRRFVYLDLERRKGLFRLRGGGRRPKVDLIYDLSHASVHIPASHTLERALSNTQRHLPSMMANTLLEQMRRDGILKG